MCKKLTKLINHIKLNKMKKTISFVTICTLFSLMTFAQIKKTTISKKVAPSTKIQKKYITMCGEKYEDNTDFKSSLPFDWETIVESWLFKRYKETSEEISYKGACNLGIVIEITIVEGTNDYGYEQSSGKRKVIWTCNGTLIAY